MVFHVRLIFSPLVSETCTCIEKTPSHTNTKQKCIETGVHLNIIRESIPTGGKDRTLFRDNVP